MSAAALTLVSLPELRRLPEGKQWSVDQAISGLESLTPVRGVLQLRHHGTALEASAEVETIVTLTCARCLQQYNHALRADVRELLEFTGEGDPLVEVTTLTPALDLEERLDPQGRFDPEHWLFEQLSLRLPLVNRCGEDCPGPACWGSASPTVDPRWAALQALSATTPSSSSPS